MAMKVTVSSLDEISQAQRPYYARSGDIFVLQLDGVDQHPDVVALKASLESEKARKVARKKEVADLDEEERQTLANLKEKRRALLARYRAEDAGGEVDG